MPDLTIEREKNNEITSDATLTGITSLKNALLTRMKLRCDKYLEAIETLNNNLDVLNNNSIRLVYHKSCYSSFCSKTHLDRLRKKYEKTLATSSTSQQDSQTFMTRSDIPPVEFDKCIFCQEINSRSLRQVITLETSQKIIKYKDNNHVHSYQLAGITDLVATKIKNHLCYSSFF